MYVIYIHSYMRAHTCYHTLAIAPMESHPRVPQIGTLISRSMGWDIDHVMNVLQVRLYCSARIKHPSGETRTCWATESRYPYNGGVRRDMVELDLGGGKSGMTQFVSFIEMTLLPEDVPDLRASAVLVRWMSVSPRSSGRDDFGRPLCNYPLSSNHCLWQWSDTGRNRQSFTVRGFRINVDRQRMYHHVPLQHRNGAIDDEKRARYDVIQYDNILRHANVAVDPTTGHMLQTIQIL